MYNLRNTKQNTIDSNDKNPAGRWTAEEHRLFEEAYNLYGKNWKKIK